MEVGMFKIPAFHRASQGASFCLTWLGAQTEATQFGLLGALKTNERLGSMLWNQRACSDTDGGQQGLVRLGEGTQLLASLYKGRRREHLAIQIFRKLPKGLVSVLPASGSWQRANTLQIPRHHWELKRVRKLVAVAMANLQYCRKTLEEARD